MRDLLQEWYQELPIMIENDANAACLGEYLFGAGQGCHNMVYLTVSTGIGGGVICNGQLLQGASGTAAELGHMTIDRHGPLCKCGNTGCLESLASGIAIKEQARAAINAGIYYSNQSTFTRFKQFLFKFKIKAGAYYSNQSTEIPFDPADIDPHTVALDAQHGLPKACNIIEDAAEALGIGLVNIIHIFNPEKIILGGGLMQNGPLLLDTAERIVRQRAMTIPYQAVQIVPSQLGDDAGLIGSGALVYHLQPSSNMVVMSKL